MVNMSIRDLLNLSDQRNLRCCIGFVESDLDNPQRG